MQIAKFALIKSYVLNYKSENELLAKSSILYGQAVNKTLFYIWIQIISQISIKLLR